MLISTVITHSNWAHVQAAWTAATRRFELEKDWEILQVTDEGETQKYSLRVNVHGDHEQHEIIVDVRIRERSGSTSDMMVTWDATRQCTKLPSCEIRYVEICNSRTQELVRLTPDEPFGVGGGM